ncbi:MAG: molybdate ABC transporter substrate-binding protein [Xanthomonadales bacterium]|nr:molybdate ABC transporter substrate-binding protein [Xanthomonadales bacterium]
MAYLRVLTAVLVCSCMPLRAEVITVAVAANFQQPAREIVEVFAAHTGHRVVLSSASTGKHYAQIINGAPFDLFLAADRRRPEMLEQQGFDHAPRLTYAVGRLVLWSPDADQTAEGRLRSGQFDYLAIANPRTAPYGTAAREALDNLGLWQSVRDRLVTGESVTQALQFALSGNAQLALVARSQVGLLDPAGSRWLVSESLHQPIEQQAIALNGSPTTLALLRFLRSEESRTIISRHGYDPGPADTVLVDPVAPDENRP